MKARGPYIRPMHGWWRRDPFFMRYMLREATAIAVAVYAVVLCVGLVCLARGESAWNAWVAVLQTPGSVLLHVVLLIGMLVHTQSWFEIMPKTLPMIFIGGRRVAASTITRLGWAAAALASLALFTLAAGWAA